MVLHSRLIPFLVGQINECFAPTKCKFISAAPFSRRPASSDMHVSGWSGMGRDGAGMGEQGGSRDAGKCSS